MNNLLIFFALPLATIIIAVVLERIWKNYILVTLFTFAVYLIAAFAVGDATLLVLVIIYTFLAFIAAFLSMLFRKLWKKLCALEATEGISNEGNNNCCRCNCNNLNDNSSSNNCNCCNNTNNSQNFAINANVTPNSLNNGRTGTFRGQYRRRF